jgi:hypothetical protein
MLGEFTTLKRKITSNPKINQMKEGDIRAPPPFLEETPVISHSTPSATQKHDYTGFC